VEDGFSSNIFGTSKLLKNDHQLSCIDRNAFNCSKRDYLLLGYSDANSMISQTWYSYLLGPLIRNLSKINLVKPGPNSLTAYNALPSTTVSRTKVNVVDIDGDFSVVADQKCKNANIFFISGNLTITPNLTIEPIDSAKHACLFIVNGTTTILNNGRSAPDTAVCSASSIRTDLAFSIPSLRDTVYAFIITNDFTTEFSQRQLYLKGGVITNAFTLGLNRNVNTDTCRYPNYASELFDYEGARYIKNLGTVLNDTAFISIFETQYKNAK
jgi:hypothetical protein